jgi:putative methanogen marker protein 4
VKRIGIGISAEPERVIQSIAPVRAGIEPVIYFSRSCEGTVLPEGLATIVSSASPHKDMIADLFAGKIDAAVRGTLPSNETMRALKLAAGVDHLERIALLETAKGIKFLLAPVGVDEGWTVAEKLSLIGKGRSIAEKFGLPQKVGVLSGGRLGDVGRHRQVDTSMAEAELVARLAGADHCEILIEEAVKSCGLIIAPDGITGNLIFRTLVFLGGGSSHGAPVVNIDRIFVDTSRASPNYGNALLLAASLLE